MFDLVMLNDDVEPVGLMTSWQRRLNL